MKSAFFFFIVLSVLIIGLSSILFFFEGSRTLPPGTQPRKFLIYARPTKTSGEKGYNTFAKEENETEFKLIYSWKDFGGKKHKIAFPISKQQLAEAENEFGYTQEELDQYLKEITENLKKEQIIYLLGVASRLIARSKYAPYFIVEEKDPLNFKLKYAAPPGLQDKVKQEFNNILGVLAKEQGLSVKKMKKEIEARQKVFFESRSLRLKGNNIVIHYGACIERNRARVKHVFEAMKSVKPHMSLHDFLAVELAFIQEIQFGNPVVQEGDKFILGFWVPPRVLVNNLGDCDSKGVTFASIWMNLKNYPLLILKIPDHFFVAVGIPSLSGLISISVNGLKYTLCEVTGPEMLPPGLITPYSELYLMNGQFVYELIR